jgi:hypothetical protein
LIRFERGLFSICRLRLQTYGILLNEKNLYRNQEAGWRKSGNGSVSRKNSELCDLCFSVISA